MPLQDTPWQRAKCGVKLLEYMAAGLPAVASPVGINAEILQRSGAGCAASTPDEWATALRNCAPTPACARASAPAGGRIASSIIRLRPGCRLGSPFWTTCAAASR